MLELGGNLLNLVRFPRSSSIFCIRAAYGCCMSDCALRSNACCRALAGNSHVFLLSGCKDIHSMLHILDIGVSKPLRIRFGGCRMIAMMHHGLVRHWKWQDKHPLICSFSANINKKYENRLSLYPTTQPFNVILAKFG